ncbi:MAG: zf-HC2 domain-containing protein [Candidatus Binatus sp.]
MPECNEISLMLGAAGDGELEPDDMQAVARHLTGCASCTIEQSDYSKIGRELRALAVMPSLEGFTKSVLDVIGKLVVIAIFAVALHGIVGPSAIKVAQSRPATVVKRSAPAGVARSTSVVDVRVDSAFIADQSSGSFSHTNGRIESGKMLVFKLPGGKTLHVQPRAVDGDMIAMEVVLFDGKQPTMTADLKLESGDTFALSGEKYGEGTLLLRISPTTAANVSRTPQAS